MLNQIQLHVHEDEGTQREIEARVAKDIRQCYHESVEAIKRHIPSLLPVIAESKTSNFTVMCNKEGELNLVNLLSGQVLYGVHPENEVVSHVAAELLAAQPIWMTDAHAQKPKTLVILGLGLGYHLADVVKSQQFDQVVVYEPNKESFICSLSAISWKALLQSAKRAGIALFLQIGDNGRNIIANMEELRLHTATDSFYLYKHLNLPIFNDIQHVLMNNTWKELEQWVPSGKVINPIVNFVAPWSLSCHQGDWFSDLNEGLKAKNLAAFKTFFPNIFEEFSSYEADVWEPVADQSNEVNLKHKKTGALFYGLQPQREARQSFEGFAQHPHKDGIILGYKGKKLRNYLHYQMVVESESVMKGVEDEHGILPEQVKSSIFFGIAAGYDLAFFIEQYDVEKLFICEPNKDFFFASLYAIEWHTILEYFEKKSRRLYLNIGDDGTNLTNDLLVQFQSIGPYVLANTYFYQSYYNEYLSSAVSQLREQLQVMIAMGDYFDNAKYGVSHTHWAIENNVPFLKHDASQRLSQNCKEVPIFIVGNGPSLDALLPLLKEEGDNAIIVSCGTALQTLHKHGIKPDFHAEIEANRSTYDWAVRVNDDDFLKDITLLSCNGIHPDTCSLYKRTLLAFKQGEASTVSVTDLYPKNTFGLLESAYPTVTNFAMNLFLELGFTQYYLFGTDLGFVDENYHHSKASGYYDDAGNELYDYTQENNTSLVVPGNFRPFVNTKYEFKVSKSVLENIVSSYNVDIYNINDGAKILGTLPLQPDDVILVSSFDEKKQALRNISERAYSIIDVSEFNNKFSTRYSKAHLLEELTALYELLPDDIANKTELENIIDEQRELIVSSLLRKKSLLFFYLNGTLNYINSSLTKVTTLQDQERLATLGSELIAIWKRYVGYIKSGFIQTQFEFDGITSFMGKRRVLMIEKALSNAPFHVATFGNALGCNSSAYFELVNNNNSTSSALATIVVGSEHVAEYTHALDCLIESNYIDDITSLFSCGKNVVYLPGSYVDGNHSISCNGETRLNFAILSLISGLHNVIFIPKTVYVLGMGSLLYQHISGEVKTYAYGAVDFIVLSKTPIQEKDYFLGSGDRLVYIPELKELDLLGRKVDERKYESMKNAFIARQTY